MSDPRIAKISRLIDELYPTEEGEHRWFMSVFGELYRVGEVVQEYPDGADLDLVIKGLEHLIKARNCFSTAVLDIESGSSTED